jgi:hypothetical protein
MLQLRIRLYNKWLFYQQTIKMSALFRSKLTNAAKMLFIGGISALDEQDLNFQPCYAVYDMADRLLVKSSVSYADENAQKDGPGLMALTRIAWAGGGTGEAFSVTDTVLRVSLDGVVAVVRNSCAHSWETLWKVFEFDPNSSELDTVSYGGRLQLKWGDVVIVKPPRDAFHTANARYPGPVAVSDFGEIWDVYVCLPPLNEEAFAVLYTPGVLRDIRERVEAYFAIWDATWDATVSRTMFTKNDQRKMAFEAMDCGDLKQKTDSVKLSPWKPEVPHQDDGMEEDGSPGESDVDEASLKRSMDTDASSGQSDAKKPKIDA